MFAAVFDEKEKRVATTVPGITVVIKTDAVDHPAHYGGADNPYEAIKVIEAWELDFSLGNAVKYIARAGKKDGVSDVEDLQKAAWYLNRELERRAAAKRAVDEEAARRVDQQAPEAGGGQAVAGSESAPAA